MALHHGYSRMDDVSSLIFTSMSSSVKAMILTFILFCSYLHNVAISKGYSYEFIDPNVTTGNKSKTKKEDVQTYIQTRLREGGKDFYLLPYISSG